MPRPGGKIALDRVAPDGRAVLVPDASADFSARSMQGFVKSDVPLKPKEHNRFPTELGRSFFGTIGKAASEVVLERGRWAVMLCDPESEQLSVFARQAGVRDDEYRRRVAASLRTIADAKLNERRNIEAAVRAEPPLMT